jgi:hypothetical protein
VNKIWLAVKITDIKISFGRVGVKVDRGEPCSDSLNFNFDGSDSAVESFFLVFYL